MSLWFRQKDAETRVHCRSVTIPLGVFLIALLLALFALIPLLRRTLF